MKHIAVFDIGKTNAKLAVVDLATRAEVAVLTTPNRVLSAPPYPHFDTETLWSFLTDGLTVFQRDHGIDGISVTTHGACAALLAADGSLAVPVLDYEHSGPDVLRAAYDLIRPPFAETGSAALPMGLNLGAQLHWQLASDPGLLARIGQIVTWPQYWGYRLTGQGATDLCSLGSHTDLWNPFTGEWSSLVATLGLGQVMGRPLKPSDRLGTLKPELQAKIRLGAVPILVGIHDSNASLVPYLAGQAPFSVVSTGTWVICMAIGGKPANLDPGRDMLVNVNALGNGVPSARFMGGREYELTRQNTPAVATQVDADTVLARGLMLLPSVVADSGPFPGRKAQWTEVTRSPTETEVALGFYLALMTAECLANIGASGPTYIEGPFGTNTWYRQMLEAATGRPALPSPSRTGTAVGAALLFDAPTAVATAPSTVVSPSPRLMRYADRWAQLVHLGGRA